MGVTQCQPCAAPQLRYCTTHMLPRYEKTVAAETKVISGKLEVGIVGPSYLTNMIFLLSLSLHGREDVLSNLIVLGIGAIMWSTVARRQDD